MSCESGKEPGWQHSRRKEKRSMPVLTMYLSTSFFSRTTSSSPAASRPRPHLCWWRSEITNKQTSHLFFLSAWTDIQHLPHLRPVLFFLLVEDWNDKDPLVKDWNSNESHHRSCLCAPSFCQWSWCHPRCVSLPTRSWAWHDWQCGTTCDLEVGAPEGHSCSHGDPVQFPPGPPPDLTLSVDATLQVQWSR